MAALLTPSAGFINTASRRPRLGQSGFLASALGFFFRKFFLAGTPTNSSSCGEALGLLISGFLAAMS